MMIETPVKRKRNTPLRSPVIVRLMEKVAFDGSGCWTFTGSRNPAGYGYIGIRRRNYRAHRVIYEIFHGKIPDGLEIDHLCHNRACVNPFHLEAVTREVNAQRMDMSARKSTTHCRNGHAYADGNLYVCPRGKRECRRCRRAASRRFVERNTSDVC